MYFWKYGYNLTAVSNVFITLQSCQMCSKQTFYFVWSIGDINSPMLKLKGGYWDLVCISFVNLLEDVPASWCSNYHYCTASFNKVWTQVLHRLRSCLWHVQGLIWWEIWQRSDSDILWFSTLSWTFFRWTSSL